MYKIADYETKGSLVDCRITQVRGEAMTPQGESPRTKRARLDAEKEVSGPQVNEVNGAVTSVGSDALPRTDLHALPPSSDQPLWQQVIADAVKSIVSVRFSQVASFDTEVADTSEGRIMFP